LDRGCYENVRDEHRRMAVANSGPSAGAPVSDVNEQYAAMYACRDSRHAADQRVAANRAPPGR
jgi:hypothetical protein